MPYPYMNPNRMEISYCKTTSGKSCVSLDGAPEKRLCLSESGDLSTRATKAGIYI